MRGLLSALPENWMEKAAIRRRNLGVGRGDRRRRYARKKKGRSMTLRPKLSLAYGNYSVGFVMSAQAMRGGAALLASVATAWITIAVPPLLKTEWLSEPSVTLGATTVA